MGCRHISRSDLVQVVVYGKCECYEGVDSILERIKSIFGQFNSKSGPDSRLTSRLFALGSGYILPEGHTSRLFITMHP